VVRTYSERIMVIAEIIERYAIEHPQAADTAEGIRAWWVGPRLHGASAEEVQGALDYLVEFERIRRIAITGGPPAYGAPERPGKLSNAKSRPSARPSSGDGQRGNPPRKPKGG